MQRRDKKEKNGRKLNKIVKKGANLLGSLFKKEAKKQQKEGEETFQHFLKLPKDLIINNIVPELDPTTALNLAVGNKDLLRLFKSYVFTPEARLAHYIVVEPNDIKVREILDEHPELVQTKIKKVIDKSERTIINATPLQLAYYAGDERMCETIKPFIEKACGSEDAGREEMRRQIKEKETKESEENNKQIKEHLAGILATVIQAISNEQFNRRDPKTNKFILSDATLKAIAEFKEAFDATQPKVIDKGMHFRLETLQEVCEAYADAARQQWNYAYNKCALFEDGVLAHVLTYVPANIAQEFNQGLYYRQDRNEEFIRANKTRDGRHFYRYLRGGSDDFHLSGRRVDIIYVCDGEAMTWGCGRFKEIK